ncbi:hypothetical protein SAMN05421833_13645 [Microbispora rosea]|uniref:Uncharacterized protein n=1 Tax=Microbispora rosea TaxID=58117 RepID=A0A1N7H3K9_9ACTN|nr:hypothetical protein SAMN05421833_13645 [Microbispora rosea]
MKPSNLRVRGFLCVPGLRVAGGSMVSSRRSFVGVPILVTPFGVGLGTGGRLVRPSHGQTVKSRSLTPRESARCFRSSGSLVTIEARYRTAVTTTIASTASAVPAAAHAIPAARPTCSSSGRMSQPFSTRKIWCWGPPRHAWASATVGTSGRIRAAVSSSCRAKRSGCAVRRAARQPHRRRSRASADGWPGLMIEKSRLHQELPGPLTGLLGQGAMLAFVHQLSGCFRRPARRVQGGKMSLLDGGLRQPRGHGLALFRSHCLDRLFDFGSH